MSEEFFLKHANRFEGMLEKMSAILSKYTVLCLLFFCSYKKIELIFFF